jgi:hypothetical protein
MIWAVFRWRNRVVVAAGIVALAVIGTLAWRVFRLSELAVIGAGYTAEQTCACLFVGHRTLESCRTDLEPLARWLVLIRQGDNEVKATAFGVSTATARYERNYGCTLQD